jgi:hypothetical protein
LCNGIRTTKVVASGAFQQHELWVGAIEENLQEHLFYELSIILSHLAAAFCRKSRDQMTNFPSRDAVNNAAKIAF